MRNLSRGIERVVKDEYTAEAVQKNREENEFELKKIFGVQSEMMDDPKYRDVVKVEVLRTLRLEYLKKVLQGIFVRPSRLSLDKENSEFLADPQLMSKSVFSIIYFAESQLLNIENIDETLLC